MQGRSVQAASGMAALRRLQLEQLVQCGLDAGEAAAMAAALGQLLAESGGGGSGGGGGAYAPEASGAMDLHMPVLGGSWALLESLLLSALHAHRRCGAACPRRCCTPTIPLRCTGCCLRRPTRAGTRVGGWLRGGRLACMQG